MIEYLLLFLGRLGGASSACLFWMVEGDATKLTKQHWEIALEVGLISASILLLALRIAQYRKIEITDFRKAVATTVVVGCVDISIHASHYSGAATEAILTGLTASLIAFGFRLFGLKTMAYIKHHFKKHFIKP
jgi:hypothetical protein